MRRLAGFPIALALAVAVGWTGLLSVASAQQAAPSAAASQPNFQGLWWHAFAGSESGWGINFAHQGDAIFATWFTYDTTGKGWWLSMTAWKTAEGTFSGSIIATTGPVFSALPFDPTKVTRTPVGTGTISFHWDGNSANFDYTVNGVHQTKALIRQVFGPLPTCTYQATPDIAVATNYQDLWWVADGAESGWGINLTHQGDAIFSTWFTYDADGTPLWLSMTANRTGTRVYSGQLIRTIGPPFNAVPWNRDQVTRTVVGTVTFTFANGNAATFAYTLNGVSQTKSITRQLFFPPGGTVCSDAVPTPATVTVSRPELSPGVGDRVQLIAVARDAAGAVILGAMAAATWSSSDPGVAIVDAGGALQARAAGKVTVRATIGGISGEQTLTIIPAMRVGVTVGAKEVVFRYATDRCNDGDLPDGPPVAVRAEDGSLVLFAGAAPRYFVNRGPSFDALKRDCSNPVFESARLLSPGSYENIETPWSFYREGSRWHSLLINEFHDPVASSCRPGDPEPSNPCTYMSLTYAMSTDGARTFVKPNPPAHVVTPAPYVWVPPSADTSTVSSPIFEGYWGGARILRGNDGYYYFTELFLTPSKSDPFNSGPRAMRTDRLDEPTSWRAWDGSGFNLPLTSPYVTGRPGPLPAWLYGPLPSYYSSYLERYLQLGLIHGTETIDGRKVCGVFLWLAPDLLSWGPAQLIIETSDPACDSAPQATNLLESVPTMGYSVIDHSDPTVNFERPGRTAYLYYVRFNKGMSDPISIRDRDVVRVPLTFTRLN